MLPISPNTRYPCPRSVQWGRIEVGVMPHGTLAKHSERPSTNSLWAPFVRLRALLRMHSFRDGPDAKSSWDRPHDGWWGSHPPLNPLPSREGNYYATGERPLPLDGRELGWG